MFRGPQACERCRAQSIPTETACGRMPGGRKWPETAPKPDDGTADGDRAQAYGRASGLPVGIGWCLRIRVGTAGTEKGLSRTTTGAVRVCLNLTPGGGDSHREPHSWSGVRSPAALPRTVRANRTPNVRACPHRTPHTHTPSDQGRHLHADAVAALHLHQRATPANCVRYGVPFPCILRIRWWSRRRAVPPPECGQRMARCPPKGGPGHADGADLTNPRVSIEVRLRSIKCCWGRLVATPLVSHPRTWLGSERSGSVCAACGFCRHADARGRLDPPKSAPAVAVVLNG